MGRFFFTNNLNLTVNALPSLLAVVAALAIVQSGGGSYAQDSQAEKHKHHE